MTEVVQHQGEKPRQIGALDATDRDMLGYLGLNPSDPKSRAVVAVCRHYGLDPLLKHVIVIPKGGVYITRDGLLYIAHRSGQLDGIEVVQEPKLEDGEWVARVAVYRKDMSRPFVYPGRYPANGGNRQYAPEMALKTAESHALRRAFDITGLPTEDERVAAPAQTPTVTAETFIKRADEPETETPNEAEFEAMTDEDTNA